MKTGSLDILPYEIQDLNILKNWFYSKEYPEFFRDMLELNDEQLKAFSYLKDGCSFVIRQRGDPVGFIILYEWRAVPRVIKAGILIDKKYQAQGFCLKAMIEVGKYVFRQLHANKMIVEVLEENERLRNIVELGGFSEEAILLSEAWLGNEYKNVIRYTLFADAFEEIIKKLEVL